MWFDGMTCINMAFPCVYCDMSCFSFHISGKELGETVLLFGCRHKNEDYIYEEELEGYRDDGVLSQLHVAFSRDQAHKVYVQHILKRIGADIWAMLEKQGYFYVCG